MDTYNIKKNKLLSKKEEVAICLRIEEAEITIIHLLIQTEYGCRVIKDFLNTLRLSPKKLKRSIKGKIGSVPHDRLIGENIVYLNMLLSVLDQENEYSDNIIDNLLSNFRILSLNYRFYLFIKRHLTRMKDKFEHRPNFYYLDLNPVNFHVIHSSIEVYFENIRIAKDVLISRNVRLAIDTATKYSFKTNILINDIIQECIIGLMQAVDRFDHKRGYRFSTYATYWVRQAASKIMRNYERTIKIPNYFSYEEDIYEISGDLELMIAKVIDPNIAFRTPISLDIVYTDKQVSVLKDSIIDEKENGKLEEQTSIENTMIREGFSLLTPCEEMALRLKYGIVDSFRSVNDLVNYICNKKNSQLALP